MIKDLKTFFHQYPRRIWIMTFVTYLFVLRKTIFNVMRSGSEVKMDSNSIMGLLAFLLAGLLIISSFKSVKSLYPYCKYLAYYYIFALCSAFWASNMNYVLMKGVEVLLSYMLVCIIIFEIGNLRKTIEYLLFLSTVISITDYYYHFINFHSFIVHTNTFTVSALIGLLLCLGLLRVKLYSFSRLKYIILINALLLIAGTSAASNISFIVGFSILLSITAEGVKWRRLLCLIVISYLLFDQLYPFITKYIFYNRSRTIISSGTGRDVIWNAAYLSWKDSPWLGKGFAIGEKLLTNYGALNNIRSAHNGFISVLVNTGIVGFILFFVSIYKCFFLTIHSLKHNKYAIALLPAMVGGFINVMSCPVLGSDWYPQSLCFYVLMAISYLFFTTVSSYDDECSQCLAQSISYK